MNTTIANSVSPEERELRKKLDELSDLEIELAQNELDLATLQAELRAFEQQYLRIVGSRYAQLDEIRAQIAEARARLQPTDRQAKEEAEQARAQASESADGATSAEIERAQLRFIPSDDLKKLYREIARAIHPDLATDEQERTRRHKFMVDVNRAYEDGNEARLQAILRDWKTSPESIRDDGIGAELIRAIRKIAQIEERLLAIEAETESLMDSEIHQLYIRAEEAEGEDRNLLFEMAEDIDAEIIELKAEGYDVLWELIERIDTVDFY